MRLKNSSFFKDPGKYVLYVRDGDELVARNVELGVSNYDYIEVVNGLKEGDEVVISDMADYNVPRIKINE